MIGDVLVVDATVHGYNWDKSNEVIPEAAITTAAATDFHRFLSRDDASRLSKEEYLRNWFAQDIEEAIFLESNVDLAAYHGTPIFDFYRDGHSDTRKGFEFKRRNPGRALVYGAVNPLEGAKAITDMEALVQEHQVDGIKVYAAWYAYGKTLPIPLDDPEFGFPFIERAIELGVKVIATHKALPFGPVDPNLYRVTDIPEAAAKYPEMNFEIVHSGFAFLEETAFLAGSFSNVWFNLEVSSALAMNAPRRFAEFMGVLLQHGAGDRIVYASGIPQVHPRPGIDAILNFEMPDDLVDGFGYPQMTDELRRKILGLNYLRLHGIDPADLRSRIADDEWSRRLAATPDAAPWSHLRDRLAGGEEGRS
jgi:uncharacterized protein